MTMNVLFMSTMRGKLFAASTVFLNTASFKCHNNCNRYSTAINVLKSSNRLLSKSCYNTPYQTFPSTASFYSVIYNYSIRNSSTAKDTGSSSSTNTSENDDKNDLLERKVSRVKQKRLLEQPEVTDPHIIYKGLLSDQMKRLKLFSLTTSALGIAMQPLLLEKSSEIPLAANIAVFSMVGFFTVVTPFLIHFIAKKYVTEILYDPANDSYTATTLSFFLKKKQIVFTMDELKVPDVPGPFTSITINKGNDRPIPFFVAPESFLKTSHYGRFMGYDKPIDFRLSTVDNDDKTSSASSNTNK